MEHKFPGLKFSNVAATPVQPTPGENLPCTHNNVQGKISLERSSTRWYSTEKFHSEKLSTAYF